MPMTFDDVAALLLPDEASSDQLGLLDDSAVPHLVAMTRGADEALAVKATYALGRVPGAESGAALVALTQSPDPRVRLGAATAARRFEPRVREQVLGPLLADPDPGVVKTAVRALPERLSPTLRALLTRQVDTSPHPALRDVIVDALRRPAG